MKKQPEEYLIVPAIETRIFKKNTNIMEEKSFIFTLQHKNNTFLIFENINPARSSIVFIINEIYYLDTIKEIFNFFASSEIDNKREKLQYYKIEFKSIGIKKYYRINHNNYKDWLSKFEEIKEL